jgi:phenylalanyl-tRNA synthetase beta chain
VKINASILRRFVSLPEDGRDIRSLLDDIGVEVKRHDTTTDKFTLELLANRGDHHSYVGLAREISGRTGSQTCRPEFADLTAGESPVPLVLETTLCTRYSATLLTLSGTPSDLDESERAPLNAAEIHSVSAAVDATNLANLEFGQPTHCFDADTIVGAITIRLSRESEKAWPLFSEETITVPTGSIVIADDEKILAIAGVIGCEESKTTEHTTRILLESASFEPIAVRKASRALGIHTDSSARFERGSDPTQVLVGAGRVVHLLEAHGWTRQGQSGMVGAWTDEGRSIPIRTDAASAFLDHPLTDEEIIQRLSRYGFTVTGTNGNLEATVPPHRVWDVEFTADLYEELAKSVGYNDTATNLPPVDMGALPSHSDQVKRQVEDVLLGAGFYEVFTNGFHGTALREKLGIDEQHPLWAHVETTNAMDRGYGLVKNNALGQAVEAVAGNIRVGTRPIQMYEWTRTFHPDTSAANTVCTERHVLWAIGEGSVEVDRWSDKPRTASPWLFKGIVEEIATALNVSLRVGPADENQALSDCLHPGRQASIQLNGETVGVLGEVHPRICSAFKLKRARPVYMELSRDALLTAAQSSRYSERSAHQPILRSLAFSLPPRVEAAEVTKIMKSEGPDWLEAVDIVDLFHHEESGVPMRAITFALRYSNNEGDRSAESVNQVSEALIAAILDALGDRGVTLRA